MGAYLLRRKQSHPHSNPTSLTRPQHKNLPRNLQRIEDLQIHNRSIPISEILGFRPGLAMAEQFYRDQIESVRKFGVGVLATVELRAGGERVDEHEGGFGGVEGWVWRSRRVWAFGRRRLCRLDGGHGLFLCLASLSFSR